MPRAKGIFSVSFWARALFVSPALVGQRHSAMGRQQGMYLKEYGVDSRESGQDLTAGCFEHGTEPQDDTAGEEFPEQTDGYYHETDSARRPSQIMSFDI